MQVRQITHQYHSLIQSDIIPNGTFDTYHALFENIISHCEAMDQSFFYKFTYGENSIALNNILYVRNANDSTYPWRIDVCDLHALGKGGFGAALKIVGKIKLGESWNVKYKPNKDGVLKVKFEREELETIIHEHAILQRLPHLNLRSLTINYGTEAPVLRLNYIPGQTLHDFMHSEAAKKLSTGDRLIWAIELLRMLKEQFHANGVIHRDIKPTNIIVNARIFKRPIFTIIDTDSCVFVDEKNINRMGTYEYRAPEGFSHLTTRGKQDEKSDHFSMMLTLIELLSNTSIILTGSDDCHANNRYKSSYGHISTCETCNHDNRINDFHLKIRKGLDKTLLSCEYNHTILSHMIMVLQSPQHERPSLDASIDFFEDILFNHHYTYLADDEQDSFRDAYTLGKTLRAQLTKADDPIRMIYLLETSVEKLKDTPLIIGKFIQTLGIHVLANCINKKAIENRVIEIVTPHLSANDFWYEEHLNLTESTRRKLDKIHSNYDACAATAKKVGWSLDLINQLNEKNALILRKLSHRLPSIEYKYLLDVKFNAQNWYSSRHQFVQSTAKAWIGDNDHSEKSEALKVYFLHYKLMHALYSHDVKPLFFKAACNIHAATVSEFRKELDDLKRFMESKQERPFTLFSGSSSLDANAIIDPIIDLMPPTPVSSTTLSKSV